MPIAMITPEALINTRGPWVSLLEDAGFTIHHPADRSFTRGLCSEQETVRVLQNASAVIAGGEYLTASVMAALPNLRVIARNGVGYDRVDISTATARGIPVTITPTSNHESVAETTFALLLAIAKRTIANNASTRLGDWSREQTEPIRGTTLGLVGLGRIGRSTAVRGRAFGMHVIAYETNPNDAFVRQHGI